MSWGVFTKILISVCYNINLIYVFCIVKLYLCSLSGLLKFVKSELTSFSGFKCAALVLCVSRVNFFKKRYFNIRCFSYYKAEIKLYFIIQNLNQLL